MATALFCTPMVATIRNWAAAHTQNVLRIVLILADDSAVVLRVLVKTQAHEGPAVLRELRRRVKKAFDAAGIEIPFRHVKIVRDPEGIA